MKSFKQFVGDQRSTQLKIQRFDNKQKRQLIQLILDHAKKHRFFNDPSELDSLRDYTMWAQTEYNGSIWIHHLIDDLSTHNPPIVLSKLVDQVLDDTTQ